MKTWRMILSGAGDGFFNMALDEALLISCQQGSSPPVIRLYQWNPPAVSLGYFQSAGKAVDVRKCRKRGLHVVRRITGGRAVLHDEEITYGVCASSSRFPELGENVGKTYRGLSLALLEALRVLGVKADWIRPSAEIKPVPASTVWSMPCFLSSSRYEVTVGGRKLVGSAQRRFSTQAGQHVTHSFLQHGSILTGKGRCDLAELLPDDSSTGQLGNGLSEKSTHLQAVLGRKVSIEEMASAIKRGFEQSFDCRLDASSVRENELQTARVLRQEKYACDHWNLLR